MSRAARSSGVIGVGGLAARLAVNPANVVMIDASIDPSGTTEVSALLKPYATDTTLVPDGTPLLPTIVRFQPNALYNSEDVWQYTHRFNVIVDFNGGELCANIPNPYGVEARSVPANDWFFYADHGLDGTKPIRITGGLSNTTGISSGVTYWPIRLNSDQFQLAATQGGPPLPLGGTADNKVNMRNAPAPNPRAFLFNSDFPGNANYARPQLVLEGCTNCEVTDMSGRGMTVTGAQFAGATPGTRSSSGHYNPLYEGQTGVLLLGGINCQVGARLGGRLTIQYTLGDSGECIASSTYGAGNGLRWHDLDMIGSGRQGWTVGNGGAMNVTLEDYTIVGSPRHLIDIEADDPDGSGTIDGVTIQRGVRRCGTDTIGDIAMGGESKRVANIRIGGLEGHPLDGNVVVGTNAQAFCMDIDSPFPDDQGPLRRGPIVYNYNVGGGQIQLTTHQGSVNAEYTGLFNPTGFTDTQLLQFQPITGSTLPSTCQINSVDPVARTVVLSHPAATGGTQTITAIFGGVAQGVSPLNLGNFALRCGWDGVTGIGNVFVVQAGSGLTAFDLDYCGDPINVHDNTVIGGGELKITNRFSTPQTIGLTGFPVVKRFGVDAVSTAGGTAGGNAAVLAAFGAANGGGNDQPNYAGSTHSKWAAANTAGARPGQCPPVIWCYVEADPENTFLLESVLTSGSNWLTDPLATSGTVKPLIRMSCGNPHTQRLSSIAAGSLDAAWTTTGQQMQRMFNASGVPPRFDLAWEWDGWWFAWAIGGSGGNAQVWDGSTNVNITNTVTDFVNAIKRAVRLMKIQCPTAQFYLNGDVTLGGGQDAIGQSPPSMALWTQVITALQGTISGTGTGADGKRWVDGIAFDIYSDGWPSSNPTTNLAYLNACLAAIRAFAITWNLGIGLQEMGISDPAEDTNLIATAAYVTALYNWFAALPASGGGRLDHFLIFETTPDGSHGFRGWLDVPTQGPIANQTLLRALGY